MKMYNVIFLFFLQSLVSCQKAPEKILISDSKIIYQSEDGGKTWRDVGLGLSDGMGLNCIIATQDEIFLGSEHGVIRSNSKAVNPTWDKDMFITDPIYSFIPGKFGPYAHSAHNGLYQKISSTGIWIPKYLNLNDKYIFSVLELSNGAILLACTKGIFKSVDDGKTWNQVYNDENVYTMSLSNDVIIAGCSSGLIRSTDKGEHWTRVLTDDRGTSTTKVIEGRFFAISLRSNEWKDKMAYAGKLANKLRYSDDLGLTWKRMDEHLLPVDLNVSIANQSSTGQVINDIIQVGDVLLCCVGNVIYRSTDKGQSWQAVLTGSKENRRFEFVKSGSKIYAMSVNSGC
ncbi:MAG: hypothetical protein IT265_06165 [Saprospiraceae bacterium]|nr:hypothetical protein [Saprospiraceae bacterium]